MTNWDETWPLSTAGERVELPMGLELARAGAPETHLWRTQPPQAPRLLRLPGGYLRLVPTVPDEPLVLRFDARLDLAPGAGRAVVYAGLPVNLRVEHMPVGERAAAVPVLEHTVPALRRRLAVGQVEAPQMARCVDVTLHDAPGSVGEGLAVLPLRIALPEEGVRSLDRVMLPRGGLSLWAGGRQLFASAVEVDLADDDAVEVRILAEVPRPDVSLRFGPSSDTGSFSLRSLVRALTQRAMGSD